MNDSQTRGNVIRGNTQQSQSVSARASNPSAVSGHPSALHNSLGSRRLPFQLPNPQAYQREQSRCETVQQWQSQCQTTAIRIVSFQLHTIVKHPPPDYINAFNRIHPLYAYVFACTMVFKFEKRPRLAIDNGQDTTPDAAFFLDKLKAKAPGLLDKRFDLVALKCTGCNHQKEYMPGSASFIPCLHDPTAVFSVQHAVLSRLKHMETCPFIDENARTHLRNFQQSSQNIHDLKVFLEKWTLLTRLAYYQPIPARALPLSTLLSRTQTTESRKRPIEEAAPRNLEMESNKRQREVSRLLYEINVTEESICDEIISSSLLGGFCVDGVFEDLSDCLDEITTPAMEVFLQSYRIRIHKSLSIELQCRRCSSSNPQEHGTLCMDPMLLASEVDERHAKHLWEFATSHCLECSNTPLSVKDIFRKGCRLPMENLESFLTALKTRFKRVLKLSKKSITPKSDRDFFLPISGIQQRKACGPNPFDFVATRSPKANVSLPTTNSDLYDVILCEAYRDFEGNRRFRQFVSEHRGSYLKLPLNQREVAARSIIKFIKKQGGSFYYMGPKGKEEADFKECLAYTTSALKYGFPQMLRPVLYKDADTKVIDLDFAPRIGIFTGLVQWRNSTQSNSRVLYYRPSSSQRSSMLPEPANVDDETKAAECNSDREDLSKKALKDGFSSKVASNYNQSSLEVVDLCEDSTESTTSSLTQEESQEKSSLSRSAENPPLQSGLKA
eukprot:scaffold12769_cov141-Cylindrotheca_fusiformis.AAC.2